ncbi:MAG: VIT1/CCC1 transporter family protein, partial [Nitrosomonadales bacterium]|nr:VIT1/CCC1 transporter family protein [Nitrosomonadales bacterium]
MAKNTYLNSWNEEQRSAYLYRVIADQERSPEKRLLFFQLAEAASKQAGIWADKLVKQGLLKSGDTLLAYRPSLRAQILAWLIRTLGASKIKPILAASKIRGLSVYSNQRRLGFHPTPNSVDEVGASHRGTGNSGGLRAAVFGVNDGLISIACLVMGVAGAATDHQTILLTGIAGLMAGAFSMAAGEYVSMRSQREMFEHQINLEREELAQYPEEEAHELTLIYIARGLHPDEAKSLAERMIADPKLGLDTLTREELGLNPDELGSPWVAAISSFLAFVAGGIIPLFPYLLGLQTHTLELTATVTAFALFGVGAV